jgi:ureidoglycolate amidohydrolase
VLAAIQAACRRLQLDCMLMVSRAYHDSLFMARVCPTGMIFIPCKDGISHRPDEYASPQAIEDGVKVLALTLADLAGASG